MHPQDAKAILREKLKLQRDAFPVAERELAAEKVLGLILQMPEWKQAQTVCLYASLKSELDTKALLESAHRAGKKIVLPRVADGNQRCTLHHVTNLACLVVSNLGIPEPAAELPLIEPTAIDLFLVPGIGFDREGNRLGHGAGFYDRLLAKAQSKGFRLGYGYDFQIVSAVPGESHDIRVDAIATPSEIITVRSR